MPQHTAPYQSFLQLLQQEQAAVQQLLATLQQEHQALGARDVDAIDQAVAAKEQQLAQLGQLAQQRNQLLEQAGVSADKEGFSQFIASEPSGKLKQRWDELETLLRECQRQNQINGSLLETGRQVSQELLSILTGQDFGKNELYNQRGRTSSAMGQNTSFKV